MKLFNPCRDLKYFNSVTNNQTSKFEDKYGVVAYKNQTDFNENSNHILGVWCGNGKDQRHMLQNTLIQFDMPININPTVEEKIYRICLAISFRSNPLENPTITGNNKHYGGLLLKRIPDQKELIDLDLSWNDLFIGAINKNSVNFQYSSNQEFDFEKISTQYSLGSQNYSFTNKDLVKIISQDLLQKKNNTEVSYYFFEINIQRGEFRLGFKDFNGALSYYKTYPIPRDPRNRTTLLTRAKYRFCAWDYAVDTLSLDVEYIPFGATSSTKISAKVPNVYRGSGGHAGFYSTGFGNVYSTAGLNILPFVIDQLGQRTSTEIFQFCSGYVDQPKKIFPIHYVYDSSVHSANIDNNLLTITQRINDIYQNNFGQFFEMILGDKIPDPTVDPSTTPGCGISQPYGYRIKMPKNGRGGAVGEAYYYSCKNWSAWRDWPSLDEIWLTIVHELGHNFGAPHDTSYTPVEGDPSTYTVMWWRVWKGATTNTIISSDFAPLILDSLKNSSRGYTEGTGDNVKKLVYITAYLPEYPFTAIDTQGSDLLYKDNLSKLFIYNQNTNSYTIVLDERGLPIKYDVYLNKGWEIILAEQNKILLNHIASNAVMIWSFFSSWIKNEDDSIVYTIYDSEYYNTETLFNIDINKDSYIGVPPNGVPQPPSNIPQPIDPKTYIDSFGNTYLFYDSIGNVFAENSSNNNIKPIFGYEGTVVNVNNISNRQLLGVESYENNRYLLWKNTIDNTIYLWSMNIFTNYWSFNNYIGPYTTSNIEVRYLEYRFNLDLDGDGVIADISNDVASIGIVKNLPSSIQVIPGEQNTLSIQIENYNYLSVPVSEDDLEKDNIYVWEVNIGTEQAPNWIQGKIDYSRSKSSSYILHPKASAVRCVVYYGGFDSTITATSSITSIIRIDSNYFVVCKTGDVFKDFTTPANMPPVNIEQLLSLNQKTKIAFIQKYSTPASTSVISLRSEAFSNINGKNSWTNVWYPYGLWNSKWVGLYSGYYTDRAFAGLPAGSVGEQVLIAKGNSARWPGLTQLLPGQKYRVHFVEDFDGRYVQSLKETFIITLPYPDNISSSQNINQADIQSSEIGGLCCDPDSPCQQHTETFTINSKGSFIVPSGIISISDLSNLDKVKFIIDVTNISNFWQNNNTFATLEFLYPGFTYYVLSKNTIIDETYTVSM